ncbi:MAG TPA: ATP-binding cassette domain-containing protein [Microthrixaceae bacterium]|nr:ATP-binding cassette domain-containing protein [Microthrixaceae bacterium]
MLEVRSVAKRFGPVVALDRVSFQVRPGELVGFLGPNGAGKTTAMRAIMQLVALDEGVVTWNGAPVDDAARLRFGYMPAERGMYPRMAVRDHLTYYARLSGLDVAAAARAADGWLERLGLAERAGDTVQSLSSGNQQRVQLALALLGEPDLLVLDEPFSGLDPVAVDTLSEVLMEQVERGAAVLLSSHQLDLVADLCSAVVIVDRGRVVLRGEVDDLRAASPVRHLEVEFASPTAWSPDGMGPRPPARRHRLELPAGTAVEQLLGSARAAGEVVAHRYGPPDLSEVFRHAVGRPVDEAPAPSDAEAGSGVGRR